MGESANLYKLIEEVHESERTCSYTSLESGHAVEACTIVLRRQRSRSWTRRTLTDMLLCRSRPDPIKKKRHARVRGGGFLLDKRIGVNQPKRIENANILIANTGMDTDKIKIFGSRVRVDSTAKVAEIETAEKEKMKEKVERILKHGINCFINRQLIYNYPEQLFASAGVMAIEHADFVGVERLALVTGEACTIVLRGATQQILDEAERSLHDALCVLAQTVKETRTVFGGGCSEMLMAKAVSDLANRTPGKEAVAMESFAKALRMLPTIIADNAGYDSAELVSQLRAAHQDNKSTFGLDMSQGAVGDMAALGITESFQVKRQVLLSAAEAAEMILRVDNIIKAAPRKRVPDHHPC
ncbi:hypothetical protein cypCar_00031195 [Cyprinus carpio]|nr:hypothetical protein cypCar_00031195 [Cyprinus carpio]